MVPAAAVPTEVVYAPPLLHNNTEDNRVRSYVRKDLKLRGMGVTLLAPPTI